jgi:hypothetical protein
MQLSARDLKLLPGDSGGDDKPANNIHKYIANIQKANAQHLRIYVYT